jgi:hypothetical protein
MSHDNNPFATIRDDKRLSDDLYAELTRINQKLNNLPKRCFWKKGKYERRKAFLEETYWKATVQEARSSQYQRALARHEDYAAKVIQQLNHQLLRSRQECHILSRKVNNPEKLLREKRLVKGFHLEGSRELYGASEC